MSQLAGPLGGLLALAFAAGAGGGWGFCSLTMLRVTKEQMEKVEKNANDQIADLKLTAAHEREECDRRIRKVEEAAERDRQDRMNLEKRVQELADRYMHGMERQLGQIRDSSEKFIKRRNPDE